MNSAAKLRFAGRATAIAASAAIVMTSFGPAAFAYRVVTPAASNTAGQPSFGLTDTSTDAGTQGAVAVTPGGSGQAMGQMKFVLPSTWQTGDSIDFRVGQAAPANATQRVSFSSVPAVTFDAQAYDETTHVETVNGAVTPVGTGTDANEAGSVNGGTLKAYAPTGTEQAAKAPQFQVQLLSVGGDNYQNVLRITFNNDSDPAAARAKFVGTIDGKIDVGTAVAGAIPVTATANDNAAAGDAGTLAFVDAAGTQPNNVTYPAAVLPVSLDVQNGSVVADGTNQNVGPLTVTAANGQTFSNTDPVSVSLTGANFTNDPVTVNAYDAAGTLVSSSTVTPAGNTLSYTPNVAARVARVVFTNPMVTAPNTGGALQYNLSPGNDNLIGGLGAVTSPLGGANTATHQDDIMAPPSVTASQPVATDLPDRIGGQDRYQTAVKIAERALGTSKAGVRGESDNVVIASGEGFADALSAGYLAATKNAQLILTRQGSLPQTDIEFLKTYGAKNVFLVGGTGSISKAVEDQLKALESFDVQAADGATRPVDQQAADTYNVTTTGETGAVTAVSDATGLTGSIPANNTVVLTRDADGPDNIPGNTDDGAITGATVNGSAAGVVVTTPGTATTAGEITWTIYGQTFTITTGSGANGTFTATSTKVPGATVTGTEPIPANEVIGENRKVVPLNSKLTVTRIAGADRFETNRKVNEYAGMSSINPVGSMVPQYGKARAKTALVANGMAPWDALAAGPLVGVNGGATQNPIPLILTNGTALNSNARMQMQSLDIANTLFIGGAGVLPDASIKDAENLGAYTQRLSGADRWATAAAISDFALKSADASATNEFPGLGFTGQRPYLANGGSLKGSTAGIAQIAWADALAAGPSAARDQRIIALTDSRSLPAATADMLKKNASKLAKPVIAVGLGDVISTETVQAANAALGG